MKQNSEFNFAFKIMRFAVAGAIPLLACMSNAQATLTLTSDANGNLNVAGSGLSQNALVIGPSNFYSVQTNGSDGVATTIAGYSTGNGNYNLTNILNIANTPTINILNGTQITTGLMDLASGLGGTTTITNTVNGTNFAYTTGPSTLYDREGLTLWQQGVTVNNNGLITNANVLTPFTFNSYGTVASVANNGDLFYSVNGQKVYFAGDDGSTPQRTVGVYMQNANQTLNNTGKIILGITDASLQDSNLFNINPGIAVTIPTIYAVFMNGNGGLVDQLTLNNSGTVAVYNLTDKVTPTSGMFNGVAQSASMVAVEAKENVLNGFINNTGTIAGYASALTSSGIGTQSAPNTAGISTGTYASNTNAGLAYAINTDNNSINLTVTNSGTIGSFGVNYNSSTGQVSALSSPVYGTAIADSVSSMNVINKQGGNIYGDITVSNQSNTFTLQNAGSLNGNIVINQDASKGNATSYVTGAITSMTAASGAGIPTNTAGSATLVPVALGTLTADQTANAVTLVGNSTSQNNNTASSSSNGGVTGLSSNGGGGTTYVGQTVNVSTGQIVFAGIYAFQVVQGGTINQGNAFPSIGGALAAVTDANGNQWETTAPSTQKNLITINPVVTGSANSSGQLTAGNIIGSVYVTGAGAHPFELDIQPLVANNVVVKSGNSLQWAGGNVTFASNATDATCTSAGACTAGQALNATNVVIPNTTPLLQWSFANGVTNILNATTVDARTIVGVSSNAGNAINSLLTFNSALGNQIQNLTSAQSIVQSGEQLRPEVNGGSYQAITNTSDKFFNIVDSHLTSSYAGVGSASQELNGAWMQAFGSQGNQDTRNGIDGYKLESYGVALGADHLAENNIRVGLAGSYAQSNVNDQGVNLGNTSTIKSYQGSVYASKDFNGTYINALLGLGDHDISSVRQVLGNAVDGSHTAWQYSAKLDVGHPINYNILTLVPVASLAYSHLSENAFTESGIGALSINSKDTDSFKTGLGFKGLLPLPAASNLHGNLEFRALWNHEFANTAQDTTATFVGGTNAFTVSGINPERDSADLGASLRLTGGGDVVKQSVSLNYDANVKSQYVTQYVTLNARFDF